MITGLPVNNSALVFLKAGVAGISKEPHSGQVDSPSKRKLWGSTEADNTSPPVRDSFNPIRIDKLASRSKLVMPIAFVVMIRETLGMRFSPNFMWVSCGYALTIYPKITLISTVAILMDQRDA